MVTIFAGQQILYLNGSMQLQTSTQTSTWTKIGGQVVRLRFNTAWDMKTQPLMLSLVRPLVPFFINFFALKSRYGAKFAKLPYPTLVYFPSKQRLRRKKKAHIPHGMICFFTMGVWSFLNIPNYGTSWSMKCIILKPPATQGSYAHWRNYSSSFIGQKCLSL